MIAIENLSRFNVLATLTPVLSQALLKELKRALPHVSENMDVIATATGRSNEGDASA
jgi:hypothetical protein